MSKDVLHISSLLVRANPEHVQQVLAEIAKLPGSEVPMTDETGKIIVTLETPSESEIVDSLTTLQLIDGVVSASLVYHQADSDAAAT